MQNVDRKTPKIDRQTPRFGRFFQSCSARQLLSFDIRGGAGQNKDRRDSFFLKDSDCSAQHQPRRRLEQKPASKVSLVFEDERYERKVLLRRPSP